LNACKQLWIKEMLNYDFHNCIQGTANHDQDVKRVIRVKLDLLTLVRGILFSGMQRLSDVAPKLLFMEIAPCMAGRSLVMNDA